MLVWVLASPDAPPASGTHVFTFEIVTVFLPSQIQDDGRFRVPQAREKVFDWMTPFPIPYVDAGGIAWDQGEEYCLQVW